MNRFKQKIKDYDVAIAMEGIQPAMAGLAFGHRTRFLDRVYNFVKESNHIENIHHEINHKKAEGRLRQFLELDSISVANLCTFNTGHGRLRTNGECVRVGNHFPPKGGQNILYKVESIVAAANQGADPFHIHGMFETLHPFTDGNGRTGRVVRLWQMVNQQAYNIDNLFLQEWYYQSLDRGRS